MLGKKDSSETTVKKKGGKLKVVLIAFAALVLFAALQGGCGKTQPDPSPDSGSQQVEASSVAKEEGTAPSVTSPQADEKPTEAAPDPDVPKEYANALARAESYSTLMSMSRQGIYDQLTSEYGDKFSAEAAQYAVDNLEADYNANALAKAEQYSETMHMSKLGIYGQLTSEYGEQFTADEAQYAVDNLVADYNANALAKAKSYEEQMAMSPSAIYDQLVSEYGEQFTAEEAQYAIDHLGD